MLNTVTQGDCLEVMKGIPAGSVDMILADLPYGTTACAWDCVIPFAPLWEQYKRVIKKNGAIVLTASQPFTSALVMSNPKQFKCAWVWEKNMGSNFLNTNRVPMKEHEDVLVFSYGSSVYNPIPIRRTESGASRSKYDINPCNNGKRDAIGGFEDTVIRKRNPDIRVPRSIIKFNVERGLHPTQKPVALFEYLIKTYSNEGETVLDNCAGSGTTAVACLNTNRNYILIEREERYISVINKRIAEATAQLRMEV